MEQDLRSLLLSAQPVAALIDSRVSWWERPQRSSLPGIVLTHVGDRDISYTVQGPSGLDETRVQVDCYATTGTQAHTLGKAVRAALDGFHGRVGSTDFRAIMFSGSRPSREDTEAERVFRVSIDFLVTHSEA